MFVCVCISVCVYLFKSLINSLQTQPISQVCNHPGLLQPKAKAAAASSKGGKQKKAKRAGGAGDDDGGGDDEDDDDELGAEMSSLWRDVVLNSPEGRGLGEEDSSFAPEVRGVRARANTPAGPAPRSRCALLGREVHVGEGGR